VANTYTQIYVQIVFAVEGRQSLIAPEHNDEVQKYISGIVSAQKHKPIAINNVPDHLHLLVGLRPDAALSELVRDIKANSSRFINGKHWVKGRFSWQEGFGAFSIHAHSLARSFDTSRTSKSTTLENRFSRNTQHCWTSSRWITTGDMSFDRLTNDFPTMPPLTGLKILCEGDFYKYGAPTALCSGRDCPLNIDPPSLRGTEDAKRTGLL
jgi:REP element-mobilizing transposase RayT